MKQEITAINEATQKNINHEENLKALTTEEMNAVKRMLNKIWGITEILQADINYIEKIYTTPLMPKKKNMSREERIANLKHKLLTSRKKRD